MVIGTSGPKAQAHTVNRSINTTVARSNPSSTGHEWATSLGAALRYAGLTKMEV